MAINSIGRAIPPPAQPSKPAESAKDAAVKASGMSRADSAQGGPAQAVVAAASAEISALASQSALEAGDAPVDMERVAALKAAIENGSYHVDPEQVARGMVDLEAKLNGG